MNKREKTDLILVLLWPIFATIISFLTKTPFFFISAIYFMLIPAVYLSYRAPKYVKRALVFSAIFSMPLMIIIEYVAQITKQWLFPHTLFPTIFNIVTLDILFAAFFNTYYVVIFYEYFLDKHFSKRLWSPHMKYLVYIILAFMLPFTILFYLASPLLHIPHSYFWIGLIILLIPITLQVCLNRSILPKFFKVATYFFYLTFLQEITALRLGQWIFPATDYVGWISLPGVGFPIEELYWLLLFALAALTFYEFFECDEK